MFRNIRFILGTAALAVLLLQQSSNVAHADQTATPSISAPTTDSTASQPKKDRHWVIMPAVTEFLPSSSRTKNAFGSSWLNFGFVMGVGTKDRVYDKVEFHVDGIVKSNDNGHVYMFPAGVSYTSRPAKMKYMTPYVGATADAYFVSLKSEVDNINSGLRTTLGGSVFAGVDFDKHLALRAGYLFCPKVATFDLSGLNVTALLQF